MRTPGPGAYYPEFASLRRPVVYKAQPFGSTTSRFDVSEEVKSKKMPAPGSYDLEEIDSLMSRIQKKSQITAFGRPKAFGSVSERFQYTKQVRRRGQKKKKKKKKKKKRS
jgi:hypothetical protein